MNDIVKIYRTSKESLYNTLLCISGALIYLGVIYILINSDSSLMGFLPLFFYVILIALFLFVSTLLFRANAMGNMVLISNEQFPEIHKMVVDGAKRVGMRSPPDAFLYNSNGILNAFARQIFGRKYLLLTSALVDVTTDEQVNFIIGHELAHHAAGHLNSVGFWLRFPARIIPFLHSAYSRQCEYTCDKIGYYISRDSNHACAALQMLGCGCQRLNGKMNIFAFEKQELQVPPISGFFSEIIRSHPRLTRRITSLKNSRLMD